MIESVGRPVKLPFTAADIRKFVAGIGARGQAPRLSRAGGRPRIPAQGAPGRPLRSVPRRNPRRHVFDIENLPRRPGETARQAVARVRQVVGKTINDIPGASKLWNQARRTVMGGTRLTSKNAVSFYERTRPVFWRLVRGNPAVRARFERAGFEFTGSSGSAPVIKGIRPHQPVYQGARGTAPQTTPPRGRTTRRPQISPRELRLSLDHTSRKSVDWRSALDPKNLQIMPERPNWFREVVQSRHDIPD